MRRVLSQAASNHIKDSVLGHVFETVRNGPQNWMRAVSLSRSSVFGGVMPCKALFIWSYRRPI